MATYLELAGLFSGAQSEQLIQKIRVATVEATRIIGAGEDNVAPFDQTTGAHDNRVRWAGRAIESTGPEADKLFKLILAQNKTFSVAQILAASDSAIQSNANQMVDVLAKALALSGV